MKIILFSFFCLLFLGCVQEKKNPVSNELTTTASRTCMKDSSQVFEVGQEHDFQGQVSYTVRVTDAIDNKEVMVDENHATFLEVPILQPINLDLGEIKPLKGLFYIAPVEDDNPGRISKYRLFVSKDGQDWTHCQEAVTFATSKSNPSKQYFCFDQLINCRYVLFIPLKASDGGTKVRIAEIGLFNRIS